MKYRLIIFLICFVSKISAQNNRNIIYLKYDKSMSINEYYDSLESLNIDLRFTISGQDKMAKPTTYNYWIDNITLDGNIEFDNIKNIISEKELRKLNLISLKDLKKMNSCDLFFLLADNKLFLIKESKGLLYKYSLGYKSTQRGIEYQNN